MDDKRYSMTIQEVDEAGLPVGVREELCVLVFTGVLRGVDPRRRSGLDRVRIFAEACRREARGLVDALRSGVGTMSPSDYVQASRIEMVADDMQVMALDDIVGRLRGLSSATGFRFDEEERPWRTGL